MDSEESTPVSRTNSTTVVINGVVFSLSPNNNESEKSDFAPEKFDVTSDTGLIGGDPVMPAFVVEKGLVLSVSDDISSSSQEPLGVSTTAVDLRHLHSAVTAQFLAQAGLQADGASSQLLHTPEGSLDEAAGLTSSANHEELSLVGDSTLESVNIKLEPSEHCCNRGGEEELKKKKGGWPKGKKRKKERETNVPKAPVTAYVLFAMERRQTIRETNPDLPFPSVTKILGNEWSAMTADEKQKYVDEAEADKKRYIEELKAYQRSEAYQEFLKKKKVKNSTGNQILGRIDPAAECVEEGLFCEVCDMYFMSHHNRKEHMFGKQHLQNVTKEFEEEQMKQASQVRAQNDPLAADLSQDIFNNSESDQSLLDNMSGGRDSSLLYIQDFIQNFLRKNYDRELEIVELRKSVEIARQKNAEFLTKAEEARVFQTKLEQHVGMLRAYGAALATQIDQLRMVPTLFGVINF